MMNMRDHGYTMDDYRAHRAKRLSVKSDGATKDERVVTQNMVGDASKLTFLTVSESTWNMISDAARDRGMSAGHLFECVLVDALDREGASK